MWIRGYKVHLPHAMRVLRKGCTSILWYRPRLTDVLFEFTHVCMPAVPSNTRLFSSVLSLPGSSGALNFDTVIRPHFEIPHVRPTRDTFKEGLLNSGSDRTEFRQKSKSQTYSSTGIFLPYNNLDIVFLLIDAHSLIDARLLRGWENKRVPSNRSALSNKRAPFGKLGK